jgi:hypothetical protein
VSLEGRIRELAVPELCQLLGSSRKTGVLHLHAPLYARAAEIRFLSGVIVNASQWPIGTDGARIGTEPAEVPDARRVEAEVLDLLTWQEGAFHFVADSGGGAPSGVVRLGVDSLLVEAAHRASVWDSVRARVPDARVIPSFVDIEPQQLPLLRLVPQEWEVLTRVDGRRNLSELATVLDRTILDVAQIVYALIGAGLLTVSERNLAPRRMPTPPVQVAIQAHDGVRIVPIDDVWIPSEEDTLDDSARLPDDDVLFDPIALGVIGHDGLPHHAAPSFIDHVDLSTASRESDHGTRESTHPAVASAPLEPSFPRYDAGWSALEADSETLCSHGDTAARQGDLAGALTYWSMALRRDETLADADRIREAIALAARLHALLHPTHRA